MHKRASRYILALVLAFTLAQALLYSYTVAMLLEQPALGGIDYVSFYTGGQIFRRSPNQLYDLATQRAIQVPIVGSDFVPGGVLPFNHPPFVAALAALSITDSYQGSYLRWLGLLALVGIGCGVMIYQMLRSYGWARGAAIISTLAHMALYPVFIAYLKGQDTWLMLLGALVWLWALLRGRDRAAGISLALAMVKPQLGLMLGGPLLCARRPVGRWFVVAAALLGALSMALVGWQGVNDFLSVMRLSASGAGYGMNPIAMYNLTGLLLRLGQPLNIDAIRAITWFAFALALLGLSLRWWRLGAAIGPADVGFAVLVVLFCSPHLHYHDLSLLVVVSLCLAILLAEHGECWQLVAYILPVGAGLLLQISQFLPGQWPYITVYFVMLAFAVALGFAGRKGRGLRAEG